MKTTHDNEIGFPTFVDSAEWQKALDDLVVKLRTPGGVATTNTETMLE
jgi:hypothetical protein